MKVCRVCGEKRKSLEFPSAGIINGKQYRRLICKVCYHAMKTERRYRLRELLVEYKKTQHCNRCPVQDHRVLQFHHEDGNKEFNVSEMNGHSWKKVLAEIKKCEVLCANCHQIHHYVGG